ncbi:hypothetical protein CYMTET_24232 [Cymbomonas tetramitiformis]|uniref:Uncharacterized protein n=1 Tax=Cymbomonas tetramitiformis TaxID=36881 RepID=A0AAE0L0H3_9CHLO|nr:hypothetical protein CYMTET_24232 [Cymbomonas tetramitiformis]
MYEYPRISFQILGAVSVVGRFVVAVEVEEAAGPVVATTEAEKMIYGQAYLQNGYISCVIKAVLIAADQLTSKKCKIYDDEDDDDEWQ